MLIGYMPVSSDADRQNTDLQLDALLNGGVDHRHLFEDRTSGTHDDRSGLAKAITYLKPGNVLVVWIPDLLGGSLTHLIEIINTLKGNQVAFCMLMEGMANRHVADFDIELKHLQDHIPGGCS